MSAAPATESLRKSLLAWLGYKFANRYENDDFIDLLATTYNEWAKGVLGRSKMFWPRQESTKSYFNEALRAANLTQLQDFVQVRYIHEHPVSDGWTLAFRATLCTPVDASRLKPRLISRQYAR